MFHANDCRPKIAPVICLKVFWQIWVLNIAPNLRDTMAGVADPVASGLVARLDRPSGNITGFAAWEPTMGGKWLELLSEVAPGLKRVAIIFNPDTASISGIVTSFEAAARSLNFVAITAPVHSDAEIETAITALGREPGGGFVVIVDAFALAHRAPIISAAARNNVPAVYSHSVFAREGGLLTYGIDPVDLFRRAATYVESRAIFRCSFRQNWRWSSTSRQPSLLDLRCRNRFCCAPTR
jgi:ABC-type uncharacterized transport system substrate-binding protein